MVKDELTAMLAHDERHWWYRGRRRILGAELDRLELPARPVLLDAGCGSGRWLDELLRYGTVAGVDLDETAVAAAQARGHSFVFQGSVEALPFCDQTFDLVTCLDVVEHTPDDRRTFAELRRVTRAGGLLVVTVPAYPSLWSAHDEANLHYRRYRRASLAAAATEAGWDVVRHTHFNALLLGPAAVARRLQRRRAHGSDLDLTPAWADRLLEQPMALEARLLARGASLPLGLSLLMVLRRPAAVSAAHEHPIHHHQTGDPSCVAAA